MVHPLPEKLIKEFAGRVEKLYVIEELEPFIENYCHKMGIKVIGKELLPVIGEYNASLIKEKVFGIKEEKPNNIEENVPLRPPVLCPGCPHRGTYYVLKT